MKHTTLFELNAKPLGKWDLILCLSKLWGGVYVYSGWEGHMGRGEEGHIGGGEGHMGGWEVILWIDCSRPCCVPVQAVRTAGLWHIKLLQHSCILTQAHSLLVLTCPSFFALTFLPLSSSPLQTCWKICWPNSNMHKNDYYTSPASFQLTDCPHPPIPLSPSHSKLPLLLWIFTTFTQNNFLSSFILNTLIPFLSFWLWLSPSLPYTWTLCGNAMRLMSSTTSCATSATSSRPSMTWRQSSRLGRQWHTYFLVAASPHGPKGRCSCDGVGLGSCSMWWFEWWSPLLLCEYQCQFGKCVFWVKYLQWKCSLENT